VGLLVPREGCPFAASAAGTPRSSGGRLSPGPSSSPSTAGRGLPGDRGGEGRLPDQADVCAARVIETGQPVARVAAGIGVGSWPYSKTHDLSVIHHSHGADAPAPRVHRHPAPRQYRQPQPLAVGRAPNDPALVQRLAEDPHLWAGPFEYRQLLPINETITAATWFASMNASPRRNSGNSMRSHYGPERTDTHLHHRTDGSPKPAERPQRLQSHPLE
jgi:hypothetical protein